MWTNFILPCCHIYLSIVTCTSTLPYILLSCHILFYIVTFSSTLPYVLYIVIFFILSYVFLHYYKIFYVTKWTSKLTHIFNIATCLSQCHMNFHVFYNFQMMNRCRFSTKLNLTSLLWPNRRKLTILFNLTLLYLFVPHSCFIYFMKK